MYQPEDTKVKPWSLQAKNTQQQHLGLGFFTEEEVREACELSYILWHL